jgi:hypothetical protein
MNIGTNVWITLTVKGEQSPFMGKIVDKVDSDYYIAITDFGRKTKTYVREGKLVFPSVEKAQKYCDNINNK